MAEKDKRLADSIARVVDTLPEREQGYLLALPVLGEQAVRKLFKLSGQRQCEGRGMKMIHAV